MSKFLTIFSLFALSHFGVAQNTCEESVTVSCNNQIQTEINKYKSSFDKCRIADGLEKCLRESGCGISESAIELLKLKNFLQCSEAPTGQTTEHDDSKCEIRKLECERHLSDTTIKDVTRACNQLKEYDRCMDQKECPVYVARKIMLEHMKVVGVTDCPDITKLICANLKMVETCEVIYVEALQMFDMAGEECGLANGLTRCLKNKAKCTHDSSKQTLDKIITNSACIEVVDNCDERAVEACELDMVLDNGVPTCAELKKYSDCLKKNAKCDDHAQLILRNLMTDKKVDCPEVGACNKLKEEACVKNLSNKTKIDCKELENYGKCMKRAECNLQYLQKRFQEQKERFIPGEKCDVDIDTLNPAEVSAECQRKLDECNYAVNVEDPDISNIVGKPNETCQNLKNYYDCMGNDLCPQGIVRQRMAVYMKQLKVHDCPDLPEGMCEKMEKLEECEVVFGQTIQQVSAEGDETMCPILAHLATCLRKNARCRSGTVRRLMEKYLVRNQQCAEIDLCDLEEEEACLAKMDVKATECRGVEEYQKCMMTTANCQEGHVRAVVRSIMSDNKVKCGDINDCNAAQELVCKLQLEEEVDGDKCGAFKKYQECMSGAQCNAEFLKKDVERGNKELGHPCGSSSLLPSLLLVFVLFIFS